MYNKCGGGVVVGVRKTKYFGIVAVALDAFLRSRDLLQVQCPVLERWRNALHIERPYYSQVGGAAASRHDTTILMVVGAGSETRLYLSGPRGSCAISQTGMCVSGTADTTSMVKGVTTLAVDFPLVLRGGKNHIPSICCPAGNTYCISTELTRILTRHTLQTQAVQWAKMKPRDLKTRISTSLI